MRCTYRPSEESPRRPYHVRMHRLDDEKRLVRDCIEGDPAAWETFVTRYSEVVAASIGNVLHSRGIAGDQALADSIFHDVFFELWRDGAKVLRRFAFASSLKTYLWIVARRKALGKPGKKREKAGGGLLLDKASLKPDDSPAPPDALEKRQTREMVARAVSELEKRDREAITLYYLESLSMEEVAKRISLSIPAAAMVVLRARKKLQKIIKKKEKNA